MKTIKTNNKGFTLVELLVVVSIIAMLSSVVLVAVQGARDKGIIAGGLKFATYNDRAVGDRLVAAWPFNECSGATTLDSSTKGNTGTIVGAAWSSTESPIKPGCSLSFAADNKVTTTYVQTAVTQYTISAWIKSSRNDGEVSGIINDRGPSPDDGSGKSITMTMNGTGTISCGLDTDNTYVGMTSSETVNNNKWHNVTCTFNSVSGSRVTASNFVIFIDGKRSATLTPSDFGPAVNSPLTGHAVGTVVGRHDNWENDFIGYIDDVRIYAASLVAFDVEKLYLAGLPEHSMALK